MDEPSRQTRIGLLACEHEPPISNLPFPNNFNPTCHLKNHLVERLPPGACLRRTEARIPSSQSFSLAGILHVLTGVVDLACVVSGMLVHDVEFGSKALIIFWERGKEVGQISMIVKESGIRVLMLNDRNPFQLKRSTHAAFRNKGLLVQLKNKGYSRP